MDIQQAAVWALGEFLQADRVFYSEVQPGNESVVISDNYVREGVPKFLGEVEVAAFGDATKALRKGQTVVLTDVTTDKFSEEEKEAYASNDMIAAVAVPLVEEGAWVATLVVHSRTPRQWKAEEVALIEETAERTWAAIERAKAEAALRESEARLAQDLANAKLLQQFSNEVIHLSEPDKIYRLLLHTAMKLMQSDLASVQSYSAQTETLTLIDHKNFHPESAAFWSSVSAGSGSVCGEALRHQSRILVKDIEAEEFAKSELEIFRLSGIRAVQSTPINSSNGRLIGMLNTQ